MKILLLTDEVWNDDLHGNNILTNWFEGIDAEFANIYCSPGHPLNNSCEKYFQITDKMMLRSLVSKSKAGKPFHSKDEIIQEDMLLSEPQNQLLYSTLKSITTESLRAIRELIWNYGKYDTEALSSFIKEFKPDIIFSPRLATIKILRLEKIVYDLTNVPIVAFTGDAEYTLKMFRISPIFWMKRLALRRKLRAMMPNYSLYYTLSNEQKLEYEEEFGTKVKILRKTGDFNKYTTNNQKVKSPIKMVYAGKLYSNRWKTLADIVKAIKVINQDEKKIILEIYSKDKLTKKQYRLLNDGRNSIFRGGVKPEMLNDIYNRSDISLHVESFDLRNKLLTRLSFSTKIIDCLESGCAVMVVAWNKHSGYEYLESEDAAITISNKKEITMKLNEIVENNNLILQYSRKAFECGMRNHNRESVQDMILNDFKSIIQTANF